MASTRSAEKSRLVRAALGGGLAVLALALASCLTTTADMAAVQTDINNLKSDSYQAAKNQKALEGRISALQKAIDDMAAKSRDLPKEDSLSALRNSQTSLYSQVSDLLKDVQTLNGRFDENKFSVDKQLKQTSAEVELLKSKLDESARSGKADSAEALRSRLVSIEAELAIIKGRLSALEAAPRQSPAAASDPQALYDDAYNVFNQKQYSEARRKWQEFLKASPDHKLAGNAHFWIGETFYAEGDFDDAILAYEEVLEKHKDNQKVPAAMLKQAYAFLSLGDTKAAKGILRSLVEKYPKSDMAEAAKKKLETLK